MATIIKIDPKQDLGITLADFNTNGHLGQFQVPTWALDLYTGKTDEDIFDDFVAGIYEGFTPIIGESLAWLSVANKPYFESNKIKENVRLAIYQEISNWMMNVPFEVKNNVNFNAQAGFNFSISIQPWLINYDEFNIKTRTYIQETGLIGVCIEDLAGIELWIRPLFKTGEELANIGIKRDDSEIGVTDIELATEKYVDTVLKSSLVTSHKVIAGEFLIADVTAEADAIAKYNGGGDLILTNGRLFNTGNASPGEVIFFVPDSGTNTVFKAVELIVGSNKALIRISDDNAIEAEINGNKGEIIIIKKDILGLATKSELSFAQLSAAQDRTLIRKEFAAVDTDHKTIIDKHDTSITSLLSNDDTQNGRLEALEVAQQLDDKVWTGSIDGSASVDLSNIVDQNGDKFDFTDSNKIEVIIEKTSEELEQGHDLTVGAANATPYVLGTRSFTAKLDSTGHLTMVGTGTLSDFKVISVIEERAILGTTASYLKNEANSRFATIANLALVKTTADTAQQKTDVSLTTTSKQIVGAINELKATQSQDEGLLANLGSLKTSDGDDLSTTVEEIVTGKTLADYAKTADLDALINAAIDLKLKTIMTVTFDDSSTGIYKIGEN